MTDSTTDNDFEKDVLNASKPVVVDFWAEWCGPCKQLAPILAELSSEMSDQVKIYKMDIDQNTGTPTKFNVRGIPTLILFKEGKQVATKVGSLPKSALKAWIEENI